MTKKFPIALVALFLGTHSFSQDSAATHLPVQPEPTVQQDEVPHYRIKPGVDVPLILAGAAFSGYNFSRISKKTNSDPLYVQGLSKNNVNWFDRWGVHAYNEKTDNASYIPFFVSMPAPLLLFAGDKKMRKDFFKLSFLYAESVIITGILYTSAAGYTNRLRPMVYSSGTPMEKRVLSEQKKSFFAGHVALVATSTFFMARVIDDYHPNSRFKWLYYVLAGGATLATAYMRSAAGEHFPSDILLGTAVGTLSGLLTPSLHKIKLVNSGRLSILPIGNSGSTGGFTALYRL